METVAAAAAMWQMVLMLLCLNLSPYGPPELRAGAFWKYGGGEGEMTMRIVEASPSQAGTSLRVEVSAPGAPTGAARAEVARDRKSARVWEDAPSGAGERIGVSMPELKAGARLEVLQEEPLILIVKQVQPQATSTPAGDFPNAIRVSLSQGGRDASEIWIAPGVGVLAAGEPGKREIELVEYGPREAFAQVPGQRPQPPQGPPMMPMMPGPPGGLSTPVLTVLDHDTFVVADPVTRTVTVFLLERRKSGKWVLARKAAARYGLPMHPMSAMSEGPGPHRPPVAIPRAAEKSKATQKPVGSE